LPADPNILTAFTFSSASLTTQGGFNIFGGSDKMTMEVQLPDLHGAVFDYRAAGSGYNTATVNGPFTATNPPDFRLDVALDLSGNIVANCSAYCGFTYVLVLQP
jgi:hypothetical protein